MDVQEKTLKPWCSLDMARVVVVPFFPFRQSNRSGLAMILVKSLNANMAFGHPADGIWHTSVPSEQRRALPTLKRIHPMQGHVHGNKISSRTSSVSP